MVTKLAYDYDRQGDSLFIYSVEEYEYEVSLELDNDVILDIDKEGNPVAFEFLNASKLFHLEKSYFKNLIKITVKSTVTDESIKLTAELVVPVHNKTQIFDINRITSNLTGIPETESELATA
ncbi:DUF2283 domain-containing protein [Methanobrevibacter sp. UBA212]|uniref:DUF2283 domain-containing protein n=1 Tax=Methanobrevibacter sp. UBA212 TaxID=1915476 RepID=UPI0025E19620|nr:DUF2283 domain-containing protein [Methanobrevibacter sp. UBA212]